MAVDVLAEIPGVNMEDLRLKGFKVHELPVSVDIPVSRGRRDFYKMGLVTGEMIVGYGDQILELNDTVLFFVNPNVPRSVVRRSTNTTGYACIFTETFFTGRERTEILKNSPLFHTGDTPVISLNSEEADFMTGVFQKMLAVYDGDYPYKGELIRNCIELIIHEALRIQPSQNVAQFKTAATRITHLFMDLLERQFPIERTGEPLRLRTPKDFAAGLAVHINYLNRSIKEVTGKPTSVHIAERITAEAKALCNTPTGAWRTFPMPSASDIPPISTTISNGLLVLTQNLSAKKRFENHTYWFDFRLLDIYFKGSFAV